MNRTAQIRVESRNYYQYNKRRLWMLGITALIIAIIISASFAAKTVTAQGSRDRVKLVTSVEIKKGDSLWSIASEYMSDEYDNINDYIDEIKKCNGITTDQIRSGNYIVVPYYADAM